MAYSRFALILLATIAAQGGVAAAATLKVAAGCTTPPAETPGHTYYFDPIRGTAKGDGSKTNPFNSLQALTGSTTYSVATWHPAGCGKDTSVSCASGPLLAAQPYWHKNLATGVWATSVNSNAPIKAGDTLVLMSGNYGDLSISGIQNTSFITLKPGSGQSAVLGSLAFVGSTKWVVQGLKFRELAKGYTAFINVSGNASVGASRDIVIDSNNLASQDDVTAWKQSNWVTNARVFAIFADGGDRYSTYTKCVTVTNNSIQNVRNGIIAEADNMLVDSNTIDNYGNDGIDFAANNLVLSRNTITNNLNIGDGNHNDGMQGQPGRGVGGTTIFNNVMINGNTVIAQTPHSKPLAFPGVLQGIDAFDMDWSNISVINNIVAVNAYHGISLYSAHGGFIANNTVLASSNLGTWIGVFDKSHQGSSSNNVIVRNNIASNLDMDSPATSLTADHNLLGTEIIWWVNGAHQWLTKAGTYANQNVVDPKRLATTFKAFNPTTFTYDLHLLAGSLAVGTGNASLAPLTAAGTPRATPVDLGAYTFK